MNGLSDPDKGTIDTKEQDLISRGYRRVNPLSQLQPHEYWRDEQDRDGNFRPCQTIYRIEWN